MALIEAFPAALSWHDLTYGDLQKQTGVSLPAPESDLITLLTLHPEIVPKMQQWIDAAKQLVLDALNMTLATRRPRGVIHHSDQGSQLILK